MLTRCHGHPDVDEHHSESELYPPKPRETGVGFGGLFGFTCPFPVAVTTLDCVAGVALSDLEVP